MQTSFLPRSGDRLLFGQSVLKQYLDECSASPIPHEEELLTLVRSWISSVPRSRAETKETSLEQKFGQQILERLLGYTLWPTAPGDFATAWPKPPSSATRIAGEPDFALGTFSPNERSFLGVLELKAPGIDLDAPQAREGHKTPIDQAFSYARQILGVKWVLVSDMRKIRLYSVESAYEYETFDLDDIVGTSDHLQRRGLRRLYFLLHYQYLIKDGANSATSQLYRKAVSRQIAIREGFYRAYFDIRNDLISAIHKSSTEVGMSLSRADLLSSTQRLLDRLMFIYYCEDHPAQLLPKGLIQDVTKGARKLPGPSPTKVYDHLKLLFREIDIGSPATSGVSVDGYNGELFKQHFVLDSISLPDTLHDKVYYAPDSGGSIRRIEGTWGLHVYDFWTELNEHLLGHIFQESLSDLVSLEAGHEVALSEKLAERKRTGIFYTDRLLSDFLSASSIQTLLSERQALPSRMSTASMAKNLLASIEQLKSLRIIDLACGSGAFLVSAYVELIHELRRLIDSIESLEASQKRGQLALRDTSYAPTQAAILRDSLYGVDLLPQAVEIAKLALWLRSAKKGERVADLGHNLRSADSLRLPDLFNSLQVDPGSFDLVIGNPPWGGEVSPEIQRKFTAYFDIPDGRWDSWELFILLAISALRPGGRLALVLPDSLLYEDKDRIRRIIFAETIVEKVYSLGPDWFGSSVRMGTTLLQACKRDGRKLPRNFRGVLLAGSLRQKAQKGEIPLTQLEAKLGRDISYKRSLETNRIEVFRGDLDDKILENVEANSQSLASICYRTRGEEMAKTGLYWVCPSCLTPTTPGKKAKGGTYHNKLCPNCGVELKPSTVRTGFIVDALRQPSTSYESFIDGDDIARRYVRVTPNKWLRMDLEGWPYKPAALYLGPKILIRQAGVGLVAAYDETGSRCPQSVYIYRLHEEAIRAGYAHEFILGALLSRTMTYFVFKKFGEVDPAKAHAKVTHERLESLPIPRVNFADNGQKRWHDQTVANVRRLLEGDARLGGPEDRAIETTLRLLWGVSAEDGVYINDELSELPDSQALTDLFPTGRFKSNTEELS